MNTNSENARLLSRLRDLLQIRLLAVTVILGLSACGDNEPSRTEGTEDGSAVAGVWIETDRSLAGQIETTVVQDVAPGEGNAVEAHVSLQSSSPISHRVLVKANWKDARGNGYGGHRRIVELAAGQYQLLEFGAQSARATHLHITVTPTAESADQLTTGVMLEMEQQIAEGYGMAFSVTAADEIIPALPIRGSANSAPFSGETVLFRQDHKGVWHLAISDHLYDPRKGEGYARSQRKNMQTIYINFPEEPKAGKKLVREMKYGGGYFQIKPTAASMETTSWNTSIAYAFEIEKWERGETTQATCGRHSTGRASGKLYISFQGTGMGLPNAWVSGQFLDAPVFYCGTD